MVTLVFPLIIPVEGSMCSTITPLVQHVTFPNDESGRQHHTFGQNDVSVTIFMCIIVVIPYLTARTINFDPSGYK